jgi:hypothetical protein
VSWDGRHRVVGVPEGTVLKRPGKPDIVVENAFTRIEFAVHWWYNGMPFGNGNVEFWWRVVVTEPA